MGYSHLWYSSVLCFLPRAPAPAGMVAALALVRCCDSCLGGKFRVVWSCVLRRGAVRRSEDQKTGLAMYKNFKRLGASWDNSNNAA